MGQANTAAGSTDKSFELVVIETDGETSVFPLSVGRTTVGSDATCQVLIADSTVAPKHIELLLTEAGVLWLRDLSGNKSTLVNGQPAARAQLEDGAFVKVGQVDLSIRLRGANSGQHGTLIRESAAGAMPGLSPPSRPPSGIAPAVTPLRASTVRRKEDGRLNSGLRPNPPPPSMAPVPQLSGSGSINLNLDDDGSLGGQASDDSTLMSGRRALLETIGPGTIIAERYRVLSKIAEGGMGEVYKGIHIELEKNVAIKLMKRELGEDSGFADRFKREAIAASRIGQQNICDVSDFGRTPGGLFYFVMEYLDGQTLGALIRERGALPLSRAINIFTQLCQALASAHHAGIVHRDLKPENVMILQRPGQQDFVKVLDFGVAKVHVGGESAGQTQIGMVVGTPQYMAPEQASALKTDARTDIYALGLIFYEMLQGKPTFIEDTAAQLMAAQIYRTPEPLHFVSGEPMPDFVQSFVLHMLQKKPEKRPQALEEVLDALQEVRAELEAPIAKLATPAYTPPVRPSDIAAMQADDARRRSAMRKSHAAPEPPAASEPRAPTPARQSSANRALPVVTQPDAPATEDAQAEDLAAIGGAKKGRTGLIVGALVALVAVGGGIVALTSGSSARKAEPSIVEIKPPTVPDVKPPPVDPKPDPVVAQKPVPPPAAAKVKLTLNSVPAGADILQGKAVVGKTPLELQWEKGQQVEFSFSLAGYVSEQKTIAPLGDMQVDIALKKIATGGTRVPPTGKGKGGKKELKDDPYGGQVEDIKDSPY